MVSWREEAVGQRPIVCDEQQTFCIDIKTAHREQVFSAFFIDKIHHGLSAAVLRRGDHTLGFI